MKELNLPEPIAAYFEAEKLDGSAVARCFTKEGVVKDEGKTYVGLAAIEAWKTAACAQYSYTTEPVAFDKQDRRSVVTGRVTGSFPGSPLDLQYIFTLECGKIASLEITL
ncbi:MAG TPA: nuclear transport factor 2 family protein [Cellvibrio sp.]|nr:nuclear transport factor 2 family protein [Cellvibrio sp.]